MRQAVRATTTAEHAVAAMTFIRTKLLVAVMAISSAASAQSLELPVRESAIFNSIDLDGDTIVELLYQVAVVPSGISEDLVYVGYLIQPGTNSRALRATASVVLFQIAELINADSPLYQIPDVTSIQLPLNEFSEELVFPNWFYFDYSSETFFTNNTSLLIGFRADLSDGRHYGWLRFFRPNKEFTTPFSLDAWNWNPVPDLSIKAGLAPEIPLTAIAVQEGGAPVLRITWPAAVATWNFESTTNLVDFGIWDTHPAGRTWVDVPLDESAEPIRYFRLRQP